MIWLRVSIQLRHCFIVGLWHWLNWHQLWLYFWTRGIADGIVHHLWFIKPSGLILPQHCTHWWGFIFSTIFHSIVQLKETVSHHNSPMFEQIIIWISWSAYSWTFKINSSIWDLMDVVFPFLLRWIMFWILVLFGHWG